MIALHHLRLSHSSNDDHSRCYKTEDHLQKKEGQNKNTCNKYTFLYAGCVSVLCVHGAEEIDIFFHPISYTISSAVSGGLAGGQHTIIFIVGNTLKPAKGYIKDGARSAPPGIIAAILPRVEENRALGVGGFGVVTGLRKPNGARAHSRCVAGRFGCVAFRKFMVRCLILAGLAIIPGWGGVFFWVAIPECLWRMATVALLYDWCWL